MFNDSKSDSDGSVHGEALGSGLRSERAAPATASMPLESFTPIPHAHGSKLWVVLFVVWLVLTGLLIGLYFKTGKRRPPSWPTMSEVIPVFAISSVSGWILTVPICIVVSAKRSRVWRLEPGEWLAIALGWGTLVILAIHFTNAYRLRHDHPGFVSEVTMHITLMVQAIPFAIAAIMMRNRPWWCGFFLTIAGLMLVRFFPYVGAVVVLVGLPLMVVLFFTTIVMDVRQREPRSWLHWSGVVTMALLLFGINALVFSDVFTTIANVLTSIITAITTFIGEAMHAISSGIFG